MRPAPANIPLARPGRRGMILNEMMLMLGMLALVLAISTGLFYTLMRQLPDDLQDFDEYTTLRHLLRQVESDVRSARTLPDSALGVMSGPDALPLQTVAGPVVYTRTPGGITRHVADPNGLGQPAVQATWPLPHTVIEWEAWAEPAGPYAVEIRTHLRRKSEGRWEEYFKNAHVFFIRSRPEDMP